MTESSDNSSDTPSDKPESPAGTPETGRSMPPWQPVADYRPPPYPYPYPHPAGPYPGGYPAPPLPYPSRIGPRNGLGIASLVIAIVALLFVWSVLGGVILGIIAAAIGFAARTRVQRGEADNGGVAIAGIVLGILAIVVGLLFTVIWVGLLRDVGADDYMECLEKAGSDPVKQQQCADRFRQQIENEFSITLTPRRPHVGSAV